MSSPRLSSLQYDRVREIEAERLGVRPGTLDREVRARKKIQSGDVQGEPLELQEPEPWSEPINGCQLLPNCLLQSDRMCS